VGMQVLEGDYRAPAGRGRVGRGKRVDEGGLGIMNYEAQTRPPWKLRMAEACTAPGGVQIGSAR
jgi:hypothetical protein